MSNGNGLPLRLPVPGRHLLDDGSRFTWLTEGAAVPMHLHRYLFAASLCRGRRVLDLGCGEGYGAAILAQGASAVSGLDSDDRAVVHARSVYPTAIEFIVGDAFAPAPDWPSAEVVTCFELIGDMRQLDALGSALETLPQRPDTLIVSLPVTFDEAVPRVMAPHGWRAGGPLRQNFVSGSEMTLAPDVAPGAPDTTLHRGGFRDLSTVRTVTIGGAPARSLWVFHRDVAPPLPSRHVFDDPTVVTQLNARVRALQRAPATEAGSRPSTGEAARSVILHAHLERNAGASLDALLTRQFGADLLQFEPGEVPRETAVAQLQTLLEAHPHARAVSSRSCPLVGSDFGTVRLLPMLMLRDPLQRAFSAFRLARRQTGDGAQNTWARRGDFDAFLLAMLDEPQSAHGGNAQARRLASLLGPLDPRPLDERARAAFASLPVIGAVPALGASVQAYARLFAGAGIKLPVGIAHLNAAREHADGLDQTAPESLLSDATHARFRDANALDQALFDAALERLKSAAPAAAPVAGAGAAPAGPRPQAAGPRVLILHCHCFKNAGSTFDASIRRSFGARALVEMDRDPRYERHRPYDAALIARVARDEPTARCVSSHQTVPAWRAEPDIQLLPIAFVREPLLRAASVYRFERKRGSADALAADSFAEWLEAAMADPAHSECKNYQAALFSLTASGVPDLDPHAEHREVHLPAVIERLDRFAAVGVVEAFEASAQRIHDALRPYFPAFTLAGADNRTKDIDDWRNELGALEATIPPGTLARFRALNRQDYALFERYLAMLPQ